MKPTRLAMLAVVACAIPSGAAEAQRPDPPATEADAVRMLASDDYRERDEAMYYVRRKVRDGEPVGAELRAAMLRATVDPDWGRGRPEADDPERIDARGELWSFYRDAVVSFRDPDMVPFMLAEGVGALELASMGRPALLPLIEALEDPEADPMRTVEVALRGLTLTVHDGLPTEKERARIIAATRYRLNSGLLISAASAFGLAVTLDNPELLAIVERTANDREAALAIEAWRPEGEPAPSATATRNRLKRIQQRAREALQPGFVPSVIRLRQRRER